MADISKCANEMCKMKDTCYRYLVPADPLWQSYSDFAPDEMTGECDYYWQVNEKQADGLNRLYVEGYDPKGLPDGMDYNRNNR